MTVESPIDPLPSWMQTHARRSIEQFLADSSEIAPEQRVAVFDNDGTLWCEKPEYPQLLFFIHELAAMATAKPAMVERPEYAALLNRDRAAIESLGLPRIALALADLFAGVTADDFADRSRRFIHTGTNSMLGRPFATAVYQPMLELLDALRAHGFATFIVTGGGTEFVRAFSQQLYGVAPEGVVGTLIGYQYAAVDGRPTLVRTGNVDGAANEGADKVVHIQQHLGRRPCFAAGNSAGDREMIDWAVAADGPTLGLLVNHDDDVREVAYASVAGTFDSHDDIVEVGRRSGWTVISMRDDWVSVFPD